MCGVKAKSTGVDCCERATGRRWVTPRIVAPEGGGARPGERRVELLSAALLAFATVATAWA
jgi:hypothetical protein